MRGGENGRLYPQLGLSGGQIAPDVLLLPSDRIALDTIAAIDTAQLIANSGTLVPSTSNSALIDLAASESGGPELVSLFQSNAVSAKLLRHWGFSIPNASSVAAINSVSYSNAVS